MSDATPDQLDAFAHAFNLALLWSSTDEHDGHLDDRFTPAHFASQTLAGLRDQCDRFVQANLADLQAAAGVSGYTWERAGHDFALSRNGHGVGYFDRGLGEVGDHLQAAAEAAGPAEAYEGDDGLVYVSGLETFGQTPSKKARP